MRPVFEGIFTREDGCVRGHRPLRTRHGIGIERRFPRKGTDVRRGWPAIALAAEVLRARGVHHDENDVRGRIPAGSAAGGKAER